MDRGIGGLGDDDDAAADDDDDLWRSSVILSDL